MDNQNINYNYYYQAPQQEPPKKNICGTLSFIFAMIALVLWLCGCCGGMIALIPYIGWIRGFIMNIGAFLIPPLQIAGLILGIVGVTRKDKPKGLATAGMIICIVLIVISIIATVIAILAGAGIIGLGVFSSLIDNSVYSDMLNGYY